MDVDPECAICGQVTSPKPLHSAPRPCTWVFPLLLALVCGLTAYPRALGVLCSGHWLFAD